MRKSAESGARAAQTRHLLQTLAAVAVFIVASSAQAAYRCGPHTHTYAVSYRPELGATGVRCVYFNENEFYWYGESSFEAPDGQKRYSRQLGSAIQGSKWFWGYRPRSFKITNIFGNGESFSGAGSLEGSIWDAAPAVAPQTLDVGPEKWQLVANGVHEGYTSELAPLESCGKDLDSYSIPGQDSESKELACRLSLGKSRDKLVALVSSLSPGKKSLSLLVPGPTSDSPYVKVDICDASVSERCESSQTAVEGLEGKNMAAGPSLLVGERTWLLTQETATASESIDRGGLVPHWGQDANIVLGHRYKSSECDEYETMNFVKNAENAYTVILKRQANCMSIFANEDGSPHFTSSTQEGPLNQAFRCSNESYFNLFGEEVVTKVSCSGESDLLSGEPAQITLERRPEPCEIPNSGGEKAPCYTPQITGVPQDSSGKRPYVHGPLFF